MPDHQTPLIATIAAGLMLAYLFGLIAHRLPIQPLLSYLVTEHVVVAAEVGLLRAAALLTSSEAVPLSRLALSLLWTLLKVVGFVAIMLVIGRRFIPWLMHHTAHTGSRELFRLAVYAIALGVAFGAAKLFDVSFALGAFFAVLVVGQSTLR